MTKHLIAICTLMFPAVCPSQDITYNVGVEASGIIATKDSIPFWLHTNTSTQFTERTNASGLIYATGKYPLGKGFLEAGATLMGRDGLTNNLQRRDLYLTYQNNWLKATLGAKQRDIVADGVSATNKNYLWSTHARPLPGFTIEANNPLKLNQSFAVDWGIAHYQLNDDRYVEGTRIHYKRLGLITTFNENNKLTARLTHFAQWAGTSPVFGKLRSGFDAFVNVFIANRAPEIQVEGEILNAVGNHLGSYFLEYTLNTGLGEFSLYHEHPFEDGSGTRLANFPDGLWGLQFLPQNKSIFSTLIYEYIDTRDQSQGSNLGLIDNYFQNFIYRSGWTYEGNVIGVPFFVVDKNNTETNKFTGTRLRVHHIGIAGNVHHAVSFQFKNTFVKNLGTFGVPFEQPKNSWYSSASARHTTEKYGTVGVLLGMDTSNGSGTNFGGGVTYAYRF